MSQFDKLLPGYRWAETYYGDTLQAIASRELGDATRWASLANLNKLRPPYFDIPSALAVAGILRYGDLIMIPASSAIIVSKTQDAADVFGSDVSLVNGLLVDDGNGDFAIVSGIKNLNQALINRLNTPPNDLIYHPEYRNRAWALIGSVDGPTSGLLAGRYAAATLAEDDRVQSVDEAISQINGDTISVLVQLTPTVGQRITVTN